MCSIDADIEEFDARNSSYECSNKSASVRPRSKRTLNACYKCGQFPVILQKKDPMCKECFCLNFYHKFKSVIGKSKAIRPRSNVLIAHSGGPHSSAMFCMVKQALKDASHKKLLFTPAIVHIDESCVTSCGEDEIISTITEQASTVNYPVYYSSIEMAMRSTETAEFYVDTPAKLDAISSTTLKQELKKCLANIKSLSYRQEYLDNLRMQLLKDIAKHGNFTYIFVGDTATKLAIDVLCDVSMGRGSQLASNSVFCDKRTEIFICRPMREFSNKDICFYNRLSSIPSVVASTLLTKTNVRGSIQRITEDFVHSLDAQFPATVFTIFRISSKVVPSAASVNEERCIMCDSPRDNVESGPCSALEALAISSKFAENKKSQEDITNESTDDISNFKKFLCHGCSIIVEEMGECASLPSAFTSKQNPIVDRTSMREEIKDFLLSGD